VDLDYKMLCLTPFTVENSQYKFNPDKYTKYINVPCGKCEACLQRKSNDWFVRINWEIPICYKCFTATLTYNDENLVYKKLTKDDFAIYVKKSDVDFFDYSEVFEYIPVVYKRDVQLFIKSLRKSLSQKLGRPYKMKYFISSEYGGKFQRPHYHCIFLMYDFLEVDFENEIEKFWNKGYVSFGDCAPQIIMYTVGYYIQKALIPKNADKNFTLISKGIGENYVKTFKKWHLSDDTRFFVKNGKFTFNMPRYLRDKIYDKSVVDKRNRILQEKNLIYEDVDYRLEYDKKLDYKRKRQKILRRKL
jgi:hypothetical protein